MVPVHSHPSVRRTLLLLGTRNHTRAALQPPTHYLLQKIDVCVETAHCLSCMVICAFFFFSDWHLERSDKHFVSYCCRKQWLFVCHSSACFSLYLCTNPTDTSVFPSLLIIIHSCRFQQEKETNHVVRDACRENREKAKIWTAEVDPSGAIWKYSSRALGPKSDVSCKSKIQAQWHGASSPGAFDLSSLRWTDCVLVPNSVFQSYGMAIATFCQTVVDSVAEIQVFYCLLLKTTSVLQFDWVTSWLLTRNQSLNCKVNIYVFIHYNMLVSNCITSSFDPEVFIHIDS